MQIKDNGEGEESALAIHFGMPRLLDKGSSIEVPHFPDDDVIPRRIDRLCAACLINVMNGSFAQRSAT
jgi:hypothetical protein